MKKILIIFCCLLFCIPAFCQDINGKWSGIIHAGQQQVVFVFTIEKHGGTYSTVIDIPTKRIAGLKPKETVFANNELLVDVSNLGLTYTGRFMADSLQIKGSITEGVNVFPLVLKREEIKEMKIDSRPQEPVRPYPYNEEEVTFKNRKAGVVLAGTLTLPRGMGVFPAVILITGSGPQDRDETISGHKPFLVLADYLTRQGLAVLRYDDRGTSKSTGNYSLATTKDFASDVMMAIGYLKSRKDIDQHRIGLIGHSEGGIVAPMVANLSGSVSFIVLLGATGIPGSELIFMQAKSMRGFPVPDEAAYEKVIRKATEIASANKNMADIQKELRTHYENNLFPIMRPMLKSDAEANDIISKLVESRTTPWMRYFYTYNPADELQKVSCPVLALNGSKDTQVVPKINQEGIRNALNKGRNKDYLVKELPGLNHLFQECTTGSMSEYNRIVQTFAPGALQEVSGWILAHVK